MMEEILDKIINNTDIGLYVSDFNTGEIIFVNESMAEFTGLPAAELIGRKCWSFINGENEERCPFCPNKKLIDDKGIPIGKYIWELNLPSTDIWVKVINQALPWVDGRLVILTTFYDITETKGIQNQLSGLAYFDRQLRLRNALKLEQDIKEAVPKPSLIIFDILSLRKINEAYGREIGDRLLETVRDWVLCNKIPDSDLYRIGGDEFCLSAGQAGMEVVKKFAEDLIARFSELWIIEVNGHNIDFFCNVSVAVLPGNYIKENDSLLNLMERTLQTAKNSGEMVIYNEEMDEAFKKHLQLELSLKQCIQRDMAGFEVYYQPIVEPTGIWRGLEALCRWSSPELGNVYPLVFIAEAERLKLIGKIGMWVLETAVGKCKELGLDKYEGFILSVNLSAVQFFDKTLSDKIIKILNDYDYPGNKLSLEITESTQFTFTDQSLRTIQSLREVFAMVALDDFGTGYSSFNSLKSLPVDILKIERDFVTNIENDDYQQFLFHIMVEIARALNMKLIVEGVETEEQLKILRENGVELLQGYLFSKPLPPSQLKENLDCFHKSNKLLGISGNGR